MKYNKQDYVGQSIILFPGDRCPKYGIIEAVDDLGFTIRITNTTPGYNANDIIFVNHRQPFICKDLQEPID